MSGDSTCVSVIIAAMNAEATIGQAVASALGEPEVAEVIVVDDASQDGTVAAAGAADDASGRLKVITLERNHGPAGARNRGLQAATSPCVAVLDADDFFLPGRIGKLLASAGDDWDMVADDILIVPEALKHQDISIAPLSDGGDRLMLDLETFVLGNICQRSRPRGELGFLKPIFRSDFLRENGLRYDGQIRLGEDYALYFRALMAGARFFIMPACGYVAIEREQSLSSCHSADDLLRLAAFDAERLASPSLTIGERRALKAHHSATMKRAVYAKALEVKRTHGLLAGLGIMARHPLCIPYILRETVSAKVGALVGRPRLPEVARGVRLLGIPQLSAGRAR